MSDNTPCGTFIATTLQSALALPESECAELAASLIRSLDPVADVDVDAAWAAEIQRRIESIDNDEMQAHPLG